MRVSALLALALLVSLASAQGTDGFSALFYNIYANRTLDAGSFIEAKNFPLIDFTGTNAATMWGMSNSFPAHYVGAKFFGNFTPPCAPSSFLLLLTYSPRTQRHRHLHLPDHHRRRLPSQHRRQTRTSRHPRAPERSN